MKNPTPRVSGNKLRTLMKRYDLAGEEGCDLVADLVYTTRASVQGWFTRDVPRDKFELLEFKLKEKYGK